MTRAFWILGGAVAALTVGVACSWCECSPGAWPFDGATGVDPLGPFEVTTSGVWDREVLALGGVVRLENADGQRVDVSVEPMSDGVFHVVPDAALPPGEYRMEVQHADALEDSTSGHYVREDFGPSYSATVHFEVGGEPVLLDFMDPAGRDGVAVLLFSEAIDATTLQGRVHVDGVALDAASVDPAGHLFEVDLSGLEPGESGAFELSLDAGVRSATGAPVAPAERILDWEEDDELLRVTGQPWCRC